MLNVVCEVNSLHCPSLCSLLSTIQACSGDGVHAANAGAVALQAQIKQLLTGLMLSTPQLISAQLSEALTIISSHDFPANWPQLLPELVERLNGAWQQQGCRHWQQLPQALQIVVLI